MVKSASSHVSNHEGPILRDVGRSLFYAGCVDLPAWPLLRMRSFSLFVLPFRLALLDEGADAFLGVAGHHIFGHYLCRIAIGARKAHFGLTIERGLADLYRVGGFARDLLRQSDRRVPLGAGSHNAVDEADIPGG